MKNIIFVILFVVLKIEKLEIKETNKREKIF